jgi:hypothetical protein
VKKGKGRLQEGSSVGPSPFGQCLSVQDLAFTVNVMCGRAPNPKVFWGRRLLNQTIAVWAERKRRGEKRGHCTCMGRASCFCCGNLYLCKYCTYIYLLNMGCELFVLISSLVFCFRWPGSSIPSGEVTAHIDKIEFTPIEGKSSAGKGVRMVLI